MIFLLTYLHRLYSMRDLRHLKVSDQSQPVSQSVGVVRHAKNSGQHSEDEVASPERCTPGQLAAVVAADNQNGHDDGQ